EVSPDYFKAMGIPMKAGRDFTEADDRTRPGVVIINEKLAERYWPGENPIGKRLTIGTPEEEKLYGKAVSREIVGVIGNVKLLELNAEFQPELYTPLLQTPAAGMSLVVRGKASAESLINSIRQAVTSVDSNQPIRRPQLLEAAIARSVAPQRFIAVLLAIFAGLAIALAVVGIYGVMSYAVSQRTQEIGIRMALGAERFDVLRMILGQGMKLVLIGVALGLAGALGASRVLASLLFGVNATDGGTFAGVASLLVVVALVACYFPARRATKVDPMMALRCE
ncbi:MAG TPA: ABC transporter permease, partial [Blastocatellia bacterium]|nr:ABC transporter permease [Blastocatellia bacterium]